MEKDEGTATHISQQAKMVCSRSKLGEKGSIVEVTRPGDTSTRYTIVLVDSEAPSNVDEMKVAAFVVPLGKEKDWLFSSDEGREIVRQNAKVDRLVIISMHKGHEYPDLKDVKRELEDTILELASNSATSQGGKVTFLTMPDQVKVKERLVRVDGVTKFSGEYAVEDVITPGGERYRRLIFLRNGHAVQSEIKLKKSNRATNEEIEEVDVNHVQDLIYSILNVGVLLAIAECGNKTRHDVLLIGLGGGHMTTLIHKCFKNVWITAIEIEKVVFELAKEYFGLKPDERMEIRIEDGLAVLAEAAKKGTKYDTVLLIAANSDTKSAFHCPPAPFVDQEALDNVTTCLADKGLFLFIFGCRSMEVKNNIFERLRSTFAGVLLIKPEEDNIYEVIICWKEGVQITEKKIENAAQQFHALSKENDLVLLDDIRDVCKFVKTIHV